MNAQRKSNSVVDYRGTYASHKLTLERASDVHGHGVFAVSAIDAGDVIFMTPQEFALETILFNHACTPNAGVRTFEDEKSGVRVSLLVTLRRIEAGEEVLLDYAGVFDAEDLDCMPCKCGALGCRRVVRGDDWSRPELSQYVLQHGFARLRSKLLGQAE